MLFGGMAHRRADTVSRQVDELGEAIEAVEDHLQAAEAARSERATMPGMPLPTGYGLQLRGPDEESIVLPVCLPPGFELASMVLCPEFLQRDQQEPAVVAETKPAELARARSTPEPARACARRSCRPPCASASAARCSTSSAARLASAWTRRSAARSRPTRRARHGRVASRRTTSPRSSN